jgi:peptidyl-prolyl cis-trans isomerase B (cyclophilin B)
MIQTGDLATRKPGKKLIPAPPKTQIPAEIKFPQYYHKRGAVAAAREDDNVNPKKASSSTDFYIVWGRQLHESQIDYFQHRLDTLTGGKVQLTPEIRETYNKLGGTPFLDGRYTVFGEVVEGMDVVEKIQLAETGAADKPKEEIRIIKATVVK